ncbi:MAG: 4Fe-4S dicluster domain-containing protein [Desulfobacteraceae bacterium]|nr:MAG: 4Fe-4S dicluster domain-containing protein [Desulfobacteraceae bacterium]
MILLKIKKGFDIKIEGSPLPDLLELDKPHFVASLPERIPFIKPKLAVEKGEKVKIGSTLFIDKRNPGIKFLSPGCGQIEKIGFGARRAIKEIVIRLDNTEEYVEFDVAKFSGDRDFNRDDVVKSMMEGGIWPFIRELPFRDIAAPGYMPYALIASLDNKEPFLPDPRVYLKGETGLFKKGMSILKKLAKNVYVHSSKDFINTNVEGIPITHKFSGDYPADDPGVLMHYIKNNPSENRTWYISGQDVINLGSFFSTGRYPVARTVVLAGILAAKRGHFKTRIGVPIKHIIGGRIKDGKKARIISGGIFSGYATSEESCIGFYETSLTLLPEGGESEAFGFLRAGFDRPSYSKTFLSCFNRRPLAADCSLHGDERACVNCGSCAKVCPVDILPQFAFKSIAAADVEEALSHGILDCVECGLCSYVCTSKIDLCDFIKNAKRVYYKDKA